MGPLVGAPMWSCLVVGFVSCFRRPPKNQTRVVMGGA